MSLRCRYEHTFNVSNIKLENDINTFHSYLFQIRHFKDSFYLSLFFLNLNNNIIFLILHF